MCIRDSYDVILLLTKQMANTAALPRLAEHLAPDGIVCALQNGIPEPELAAALGACLLYTSKCSMHRLVVTTVQSGYSKLQNRKIAR